MITDNTIEPDDTNRHINFKYLELPKKTIPIIDIMRQMSGNENILQVLCDVCVANDIGFRAFVEITDVDFYVNFWLYKGKENTNVISAEEGNLLSYDYAKSELDYRNAVYCLGKENIFYCVEENMRERAFTPPFGEDRQEAFLDCTSIDNHYQENKYAWVTNPQTGEEEWEQIAEKGKTLIPTEEYRSILQ